MASQSDIEPLTARETETLRLIANAKTILEIAAQMGISKKTVESHRDISTPN